MKQNVDLLFWFFFRRWTRALFSATGIPFSPPTSPVPITPSTVYWLPQYAILIRVVAQPLCRQPSHFWPIRNHFSHEQRTVTRRPLPIRRFHWPWAIWSSRCIAHLRKPLIRRSRCRCFCKFSSVWSCSSRWRHSRVCEPDLLDRWWPLWGVWFITRVSKCLIALGNTCVVWF